METRRGSLYEIFVGGESAGLVDIETAQMMHIRVGSVLTDEEWFALCEESEKNRAKEYGLYLLERRSYTRRGLKLKLTSKYSPKVAELVLSRFEELGLLNDADYARRYASDLYRLKHFSGVRIVTELLKKGIDRDLAKETVDALFEQENESPRENIRVLLETKFSSYLSDEKGVQRVVARLQRMGYRWEDIKYAIREYADNIEE